MIYRHIESYFEESWETRFTTSRIIAAVHFLLFITSSNLDQCVPRGTDLEGSARSLNPQGPRGSSDSKIPNLISLVIPMLCTIRNSVNAFTVFLVNPLNAILARNILLRCIRSLCRKSVFCRETERIELFWHRGYPWLILHKQCVALTGRNRTGPPCRVGRPMAHSAGQARRRPTTHAPGGRPARPPAAIQTTTDDDRRQRQTTDASEQNDTGPLGGPVIRAVGMFRWH